MSINDIAERVLKQYDSGKFLFVRNLWRRITGHPIIELWRGPPINPEDLSGMPVPLPPLEEH